MIAEGNEQFTVVLSNPVNATLQDGQTGLTFRAIIRDDEPEISVEAAEDAVDEGDDIVLTLTRTGVTADELTAWLRLAEQRDAETVTYPSVTFAVGTTTAQYTISTTDDVVDLGNFNYNVTVEDPVNVGDTRTYHKNYTATQVIVRDDELPRVRIQAVGSNGAPLSGTPYSNLDVPPRREEGQAMHFLLERRVAGPELTINLEGTGAGHFIAGALPTSATIAAGEKTSTIGIATDDDVGVPDETADFTLEIKDGTGYRPGNPGTATFTIEDNDSDLRAVGIRSNSDWVNEGEDVVFTVTRHDDDAAAFDLAVSLFFTQGGAP